VTGRFSHRQFAGGHFFVADSRDAVLAEVVQSLSPYL
jgi:surfactin synthase thioesterase subunit